MLGLSRETRGAAGRVAATEDGMTYDEWKADAPDPGTDYRCEACGCALYQPEVARGICDRCAHDVYEAEQDEYHSEDAA